MTAVLLFLLLGLGAGAVYALLGTGLVLKYRSTGVIDFAQGANAMFSAYVFVNLRSTGTLELPWIVLPHQVTVSSGPLGLVPSLLITLVYGVLFGLVLFWLVYRPLLRASPLTKVCASVGVMLAVQAVAVLNFGTTAMATGPVLPSTPIRLAGIAFPTDRLVLAGIVVVVALALTALFRWTRFGLATRAGAENEVGASLLGISPVGIAARNWAIASLLASGSGILITPISSLDPTSYTLFVVPALGAALIGRFASFWVTAGAGLLLGIAQSEIIKVQSEWLWLPRQGLTDGLPFLVILIAMTISARRLGVRGGPGADRLPSLGRPSRPVLTAVLSFVVGLVVLVALHGSLRAAFMSSLVTICICLSLTLLSGFVGQLSLAQLSFVGLGGFFLSHLNTGLGVPFPFSLLLGALAVVPVGILIGLPALRVRGMSLAIVTLATASAMDALVFSNVAFTGGLGGRTVAQPTLFGWDLGISHGTVYPTITFGVLLLVVVVGIGYMVARLRTSATGRMLVAIRSNERAAAYVGIRTAPAKLYAFGVSSFIAGLAGGLMGYEQGTLSPDAFAAFSSLSLLAIAYVAGIGRIAGAVIAGFAFSADGFVVSLLDKLLHVGQYQMIVAGIALAVTAIGNPNGVASELASEHKGPGRAVIRVRDAVFPRRPPPSTPATAAAGSGVSARRAAA